MREDLPLFPISTRYNAALSLRPSYVFRTCLPRPGCFPGAWSSWDFASRQFAPKIVDLSVRFIHSQFRYISSLWASVVEENHPLELIREKRGKKSETKKSPWGRIGTTPATTAGPVLSLEVSEVATILVTFDLVLCLKAVSFFASWSSCRSDYHSSLDWLQVLLQVSSFAF